LLAKQERPLRAPPLVYHHDHKEGLGREGSLGSQQIQGRQPSFIEEVEEEKMQVAISNHPSSANQCITTAAKMMEIASLIHENLDGTTVHTT
jgi:hypothetical protein